MPISATNYDGTKEYKVAEMSDLCKPNLLNNADFQSGIINQKGQTSYQDTARDMVSIDCWIIQHSSKLTVNNGYISYQKGSEGSIMKQSLDISFLGKTFTLTVKLKGQNPTSVTGKFTTGDEIFKVFDDSNKNMWISKSGGNNKLTMWIMPKTTTLINIDFIKLEEGSQFTGMPYWNKEMETVKCQYYYKQFLVTANTNYDYGNNEYAFYVTFPNMNQTPTIKIKNVESFGVNGQWEKAYENKITQQNPNSVLCRCKFATALKNPSNQIVVDFTADANSY